MPDKRPYPSDAGLPEPPTKAARYEENTDSSVDQSTSATTNTAEFELALELGYPPLDPALAPPPPEFGQPVPLLTFSYDERHQQHFDDSALRYLAPAPPIGADLRHGYNRWVRKDDTRGRLDGLLKALSRKRAELAKGSNPRVEELKVGVCTWRGVMTKIMTAPYEDRDTMNLNLMLVGGTMYLEEHLSDAQLVQKNEMNPRQREQTYFGYSFEAWSTQNKPPGSGSSNGNGNAKAPVWGGDVNTNEQWCVVVKTRLGSERLVIGGEVDCVKGIYDNTTRNLVELKTNIAIRPPSHPQSAGDRQRFERKALRIWTQSFLLGVPTVMVGFRTPQGKVQSVQSFRTAEFPRIGRDGENMGGNTGRNVGAGRQSGWDTRVVLGWGARALGFLRTTVEESRNGDHPDSETAKYQERDEEKQREVWRVEFAPGRGIKLWKLGAEDVKDVETDEHVERVGLLPRWYWEEVTGRLLDVERQGGKETGSTHVQLGEAGSTPVGPAEEGPVPTSTLNPSASVLKSTPNGVVPAGWSI